MLVPEEKNFKRGFWWARFLLSVKQKNGVSDYNLIFTSPLKDALEPEDLIPDSQCVVWPCLRDLTPLDLNCSFGKAWQDVKSPFDSKKPSSENEPGELLSPCPLDAHLCNF